MANNFHDLETKNYFLQLLQPHFHVHNVSYLTLPILSLDIYFPLQIPLEEQDEVFRDPIIEILYLKKKKE